MKRKNRNYIGSWKLAKQMLANFCKVSPYPAKIEKSGNRYRAVYQKKNNWHPIPRNYLKKRR